ncbi:MAG: ABC transporter substrate-binding protein [Oscillospiraceae bacterium]
MKQTIRNAFQAGLAALLAAVFLGGCAATANGLPVSGASGPASSAGAAGTEAIVAISSEPENGFDPTVGWGHGTTPLIQSTLVEYTQDMRIVNDLATGYTISEDGLGWVFSLRKDAYFTDGEPLTAEDVAFTFETAKSSGSFLDLSYLEECAVTGEYEVTFTLNAPASTFINTVATIGIVPKHAYGPGYAENPVGSGPWKLVQWNKGEQIILEANENYYGTVPALKKVTLVFMDEDAAFAAAMAGQVDVALTSATQATQQISGMRLEAVTTLDNRGFTLPTTPAEGKTTENGAAIGNNVTAHLAIRQALAWGIDREILAEDALNGFGDPAYSENDGMPWNNPETKLETDVAKAKALLADDGWQDTDGDGIVEKDGLKAEFTCLYPSGDSARQAVAMAAAAQAKELGISIIVEGTSWDDIARRMFSEAVLMGWGSNNPHTSYLLYHSSGMLKDDYYNPEGYANPATDAYLEAALHAQTTEEAYKQWQLAQWDGTTGTAMQGNCPWVWLVNIQHLYYVREGLDIGSQQLHAHGASWTLVQNLKEWKWN